MTRRVDYRRRTRVVPDPYCPRCLTPTERLRASRPLRLLGRVIRVRVSSRACGWCGWEGWRVQRPAEA